MTEEKLRAKFPHASKDFILSNLAPSVTAVALLEKEAPRNRVRQSKGMYDSELEKEWHEHMKQDPRYNYGTIRPKGIRLLVANGLHYTPDFVLSRPDSDRIKCFEVKGPRKSKGVSKGVAIVKMAATSWPEFTFVFVCKESGQWREQVMLP